MENGLMLTVLTPTFNRADLLINLYQSLESQTSKEFEWLVVDDGSTDNTKQLIQTLAENADFKIRYLYKGNGGKHTALNAGIRVIKSELTFIVDSDDTLVSDAVETVLQYHRRYSEDNRLCGYVFLKQFPDGNINGKTFPHDEMIANYVEARINTDDTHADKAEVFFTRCMKEFAFPEYRNEKFLGEDIVWIRMSEKYRMVHINKAIYIADYLGSGLTKNRRIHNIASPVGCMHRAETFMRKEIKLRYRVKGALQYIIYGKFAGYGLDQLLRNAPDKKLVAAASLPGLVLHKIWKRKYQIA